MALEALLGSALATDPSKNLVFRQFLRCSCLFVLNCDQFGINVGTLMALVFGAFGTQKKTNDAEPKGLAAEAILRQFCWRFMSPRCLWTLGHLLPGPAGCAQRLIRRPSSGVLNHIHTCPYQGGFPSRTLPPAVHIPSGDPPSAGSAILL